MKFLKLTRVNSDRYNGFIYVNLDMVLTMQRVGAYTELCFAVPGSTSADTVTRGFSGYDVEETPEEILSRADQRAK